MTVWPVLLTLILLALYAVKRGERGLPRWAMLAAAILPLVMVASSTLSAEGLGGRNWGDIRIVLRELQFDLNERDSVSVGGDPDADELVVEGLAEGLVTLRRTPDDPKRITIDVAQPAAGNGAVASVEPVQGLFIKSVDGFVSWVIGRPTERFIGEQAVGPGQLLCPPGSPACQACGLRAPGFMEDQLQAPAFSGDLRPIQGGGSRLRTLGPTQRIYSLRTFGRTLQGGTTSPACLAYLGAADAQGGPTGFIFKEGGWFTQGYRGLLLNGRESLRAPLTLVEGGDPVRIRLYRVTYAEPGPLTDLSELRERLIELRSFTAKLETGGQLILHYDTPERRQIRTADIQKVLIADPETQRRRSTPIVIMFDSGRNSFFDNRVGDALIQFASVGSDLARAPLGRVVLKPTADGRDIQPFFWGPPQDQERRGLARERFGKSILMGQVDRARITIDRLHATGPFGVEFYALLALIGAATAAATWRAQQVSPAVWAVFLLAQVMLSLRVLIAISGEYLDLDAQDSNVVATALVALAAVPFFLRLRSAPPAPVWETSLHAAVVGLAAVIAWKQADLSNVARLIAGLVLVCAVVAGLRKAPRGGPGMVWAWISGKAGLLVRFAVRSWRRFMAVAGRPGGPRPSVQKRGVMAALGRWLGFLFGQARRGLARTIVFLLGEGVANRRVRALIWALFLLVLARIVLVLFGWKEGVLTPFGRIALSTIYLPAALCLVVALLRALAGPTANPSERLGRGVLWGICLAVAFLPALIANDSGFIIFSFGLAIVGALLIWRTLWHRLGLRDALWVGVLLAGLLMAGWAGVRYLVREDFLAPGAVVFIAIVGWIAWRSLRRRVEPGRLGLALMAGGGALLVCALAALALSTVWSFAVLVIGLILVATSLAKRPILAWAAPAAGVVCLLLSFHLQGLGGAITPFETVDGQSTEAAAEAAALRDLRQRTDKSQNDLRIWYNVQPEAASSVGTADAERLGAALAHLADYTACPAASWPWCLKGDGFLSVPPPTELRDYHLDDNVSAVHLMAPFGRLSAVALVGLMAAAAILAGWRAFAPPAPGLRAPPRRRLLAMAVMWTFFGVALYMILANLQLTPFTGKSIYFMAAESGSDILEGVLLLLLAVWGLSPAKSEEAA